jgi:hypothetical protein
VPDPRTYILRGSEQGPPSFAVGGSVSSLLLLRGLTERLGVARWIVSSFRLAYSLFADDHAPDLRRQASATVYEVRARSASWAAFDKGVAFGDGRAQCSDVK